MNKNKLLSSVLLCAAFGANASEHPTFDLSVDKQTHWITIGQDALPELRKVGGKPFALNAFAARDNQGVSIAQIDSSQLNVLSRLMHKSHNRCGGYIVHNSLQSALSAQSAPTVSAATFTASAATQQATVNELLPLLTKENIVDTINYLSTSFTNRYYTTTGGSNSSNGLKARWDNIVGSTSWATVEQIAHSGYNQKSVMVTLTGSEKPGEIVVVGGHLDSTVGSTGENTSAPGADDDASGIATLTEVMRVYIGKGVQPKRTVKFIAYAAEEVGLRGSGDIATTAKNNGDNIVGVMQLDMTNYAGSTKDIYFMQDYTSAAQNSYIAGLIDTYLAGSPYNVTYGYDNCGYGCSDHASWHNAGFPASMPFETMMSQYNPKIHTGQDTLQNMDSTGTKALKFAQMALAYVVELSADTGGTTEPPTGNVLTNGTPVTGLSAASGQDVKYTMEVPSGATNISFTISGGTGDADLYTKLGAAPTDSSYDCRPYKSGNNESCTGTGSGTYHVRVKAYSAFSGVTLTGSYTEGGTGGLPAIDVTQSNVGVAQGSWVRYTQDLQAGYSSFVVTTSGGSGDADLYVRRGAASTTSSYDCRPYKSGNNETCTFNNPAAGTWHIDLQGYSTASGVTVNWKTTQ